MRIPVRPIVADELGPIPAANLPVPANRMTKQLEMLMWCCLDSTNLPEKERIYLTKSLPISLTILRKVAKLNKNVVVLVNACNTMPMDWLKDVKGVLWCYFIGQQRGKALANIISGKVNPSGKLPFTIEHHFKDSPDPLFNYIGGKPYWRGNNE